MENTQPSQGPQVITLNECNQLQHLCGDGEECAHRTGPIGHRGAHDVLVIDAEFGEVLLVHERLERRMRERCLARNDEQSQGKVGVATAPLRSSRGKMRKNQHISVTLPSIERMAGPGPPGKRSTTVRTLADAVSSCATWSNRGALSASLSPAAQA